MPRITPAQLDNIAARMEVRGLKVQVGNQNGGYIVESKPDGEHNYAAGLTAMECKHFLDGMLTAARLLDTFDKRK